MFNSPSSRGGRRRLHTLDLVRAGLVPTLPNDVTKFLNGLGAFSVPTGSNIWQFIGNSSPSGTGVITFSSIAGTYKHLILFFNARTTQAATTTGLNLTLNNDTNSNYDAERTDFTTTSSFADQIAQTSGIIAVACGGNAPSNYSTGGIILFPHYANTTFFKQATMTPGGALTAQSTGNVHSRIFVVNWRSTAAINRFDITTAGGNYVSGSTFDLYGIN